MFLFFFFKTIVFLTNVFDEFNDSLIVIVINTVFDLFVVDESIVMIQERLEQLRNTIFDGSLFKDSAEDQLCNKLDIAENLLFSIFQKLLFVLRRFKVRELLNFLIKRMLNCFDKIKFERIVLLFLFSFELEVSWMSFAEVRA